MKRLTNEERAKLALSYKNGTLPRKKLEQLAFSHKHQDFKSSPGEPRCILRFVPGVGTSSCSIEKLSDAELLDELGIKL